MLPTVIIKHFNPELIKPCGLYFTACKECHCYNSSMSLSPGKHFVYNFLFGLSIPFYHILWFSLKSFRHPTGHRSHVAIYFRWGTPCQNKQTWTHYSYLNQHHHNYFFYYLHHYFHYHYHHHFHHHHHYYLNHHFHYHLYITIISIIISTIITTSLLSQSVSPKKSLQGVNIYFFFLQTICKLPI